MTKTTMPKVSASGRELMSTTDPGRHYKRTSLDFYGQLTPVPSTMLNVAAGTRIQKGLIRSLYIVIDFSRNALKLVHEHLNQIPSYGHHLQSLLVAGNKPGPCVTCRKCKHCFCLDCDIYIHESLHNCPGCESIHRPKSVSLMEE